MTAKIAFFPLGNADTSRIDLAIGQTIPIDYAKIGCADDDSDRGCGLPALPRQARPHRPRRIRFRLLLAPPYGPH
jgi:hypothetical protein